MRKHVVQIRVTEEERGRVVEAARKAGLSQSEWVRAVLGGAADAVLGGGGDVSHETRDQRGRDVSRGKLDVERTGEGSAELAVVGEASEYPVGVVEAEEDRRRDQAEGVARARALLAQDPKVALAALRREQGACAGVSEAGPRLPPKLYREVVATYRANPEVEVSRVVERAPAWEQQIRRLWQELEEGAA